MSKQAGILEFVAAAPVQESVESKNLMNFVVSTPASDTYTDISVLRGFCQVVCTGANPNPIHQKRILHIHTLAHSGRHLFLQKELAKVVHTPPLHTHTLAHTGRHLFLQEKLAKLAQPPPPPQDWLSLLSPLSTHHQQQHHLPPQLDPKAVEAFLACDSFMTHGFQWLVVKVRCATFEKWELCGIAIGALFLF